MTEAGIVTFIFENLVTISPWAVTVGGLVVFILRQQEKTIDRIDSKNEKLLESVTSEKNNYYQLLADQGTVIKELKVIAEKQEETQKQMANTMNNYGIQLEVIKTQMEYLNKQRG